MRQYNRQQKEKVDRCATTERRQSVRYRPEEKLCDCCSISSRSKENCACMSIGVHVQFVCFLCVDFF